MKTLDPRANLLRAKRRRYSQDDAVREEALKEITLRIQEIASEFPFVPNPLPKSFHLEFSLYGENGLRAIFKNLFDPKRSKHLQKFSKTLHSPRLLKNYTVEDIEWNGHLTLPKGEEDNYYQSEEEMKNNLISTSRVLLPYNLQYMTDSQYEKVKEFVTSKGKQKDWTPISALLTEKTCPNCENLLQLETNGVSFRFAGKCEAYEPPPVEVDFPTGEVLVNDDLRDWFAEGFYRSDNINVNFALGISEVSKIYAEYNYLTGYCGNSCPSVYQSKENPNKLIIASYWNPKTEEPYPLEGYKYLAQISTSLWWFSLADVQVLKAQTPMEEVIEDYGREYYMREDLKGTIPQEGTLIKIPAGRYRTQFSRFFKEENGMKVYAEIERVGDSQS